MLIYPEIDPVIVSIFGLKIRWYGMMYVLGFLGGWWLARRRSRQSWWQLNEQQVDDLVFYVMLGVILGGRIGYTLFYGWDNIAADPLYIIKIWEGGMSFHGGLAGVLIAMWLYGRKLGRTMWFMTDFVAPFVPLGLGLGRVGNFIRSSYSVQDLAFHRSPRPERIAVTLGRAAKSRFERHGRGLV